MKPPKYLTPTHFDNKYLFILIPFYIKVASQIVFQKVCGKMGFHQLYIVCNTIRNKIFNYKNTESNINPNDVRTYGTGMISCNYTYSKYLNHHHGDIITRDLRVIENKNFIRL